MRVGLKTLRLLLDVLEDATRFFLRLFDRGVGRALREDQSPPDRLGLLDFVDRGCARFVRDPRACAGALLGRRGPLLRGPDALLQLLERHRDALEEVVDLVGVVPAHLLVELDLVDDLRRDIHGHRW